jgi:hypothetical protein
MNKFFDFIEITYDKLGNQKVFTAESEFEVATKINITNICNYFEKG